MNMNGARKRKRERRKHNEDPKESDNDNNTDYRGRITRRKGLYVSDLYYSCTLS